MQFAQHATRPMASYRALGLDASVEQLGLLALSFGALSIAVAIPIGRLVDRRGARATTVGGIALMGVAALGHSAAADLVGLIAAHTALGLGLILAVVGLQAIVSHAVPVEGADARFGLFGATISLGQVLGPIAAGVMAEMVIAAGLAGPGDPYGTAPTFVLTATDVLTVYLPAIGAERGWSVAFVSILLAVRAALSFAVRVGTAPLVRMLGRRPLLVGACGIGAAALLLMTPALPAWVAVVLMAITGLVLGIGQPLTMAWVSRSAPEQLRATALAVRLTANRVGQSLIPVAVGAVAALAGSGAIFLVLSALLVSTSVAVARSDLR